jgi:hypothetical protein
MPPQPERCGMGDCIGDGAEGVGVLGRLGDIWLDDGDRGAE